MKRNMMKRAAGIGLSGLFVLSVFLVNPHDVQARTDFRVNNVVDDFLAYHQAAKDLGPDRKAALWVSIVEAEHQAFFDDAVYRRKQGRDRERYKNHCIDTFWRDLAPAMDYYADLNRAIGPVLDRTVREFRNRLPDFSPDRDFYVTFSFSFRGKAVGVGGRDVLALGLDFFREYGPDAERQIRITLAHELFHLYHFQFFSAAGGLYRSLWAEGLATYASAVMVPGLKRSVYLGFPGSKMNRCHELLPLLSADLKKNMGRNDRRLQRIYFGAEDNDTKVPPEAGYYVGLLIIERLAKKYGLADLARMDKDMVFKLVGEELDRLAGR